MDKRIGKLLLACLLFTTSLFGEISFRVGLSNMQGESIKKIGAGVPFILEVSVVGNENVSEKPEIKQLNKHCYTAGSVQTSVQNINGRVTAINSYTYQVRIDNPGTYELGPIVVNHQGRLIQSKPFTVKVVREKDAPAPQATEETSEALITMSVNKESVYLYEPVTLKVRIYIRGEVGQVQPQLPNTEGLSVGDPIGPISGTTTLNDKQWDYHEIKMKVYPERIGDLTIPATVCNYVIAQPARNQMESMLQMFGAFNAESKRMVSNAIKLSVKPLPPHKPLVKHVGTVSAFTASVNQREAQQGDAIVLKLSLTGNVDMKKVDLKLSKFPKELKQYHSNTSVKNGKQNQTKTFEYIVQGTKTGPITIPTQAFTFFNTKAEQYQTIRTKPIKLNILPSQYGSAVEDNDGELLVEKAQSLCPNINSIRTYTITFWYILGLIFMTWLTAMYLLYCYAQGYYVRNYLSIRKKFAFYNAQKKLKHLERTQNLLSLYPLFIELVAALLQESSSSINAATMKKLLMVLQLDEKQLQEWDVFYAGIEQAAFSDDREQFKKKVVIKKLLQQADHWIKLIQKQSKKEKL